MTCENCKHLAERNYYPQEFINLGLGFCKLHKKEVGIEDECEDFKIIPRKRFTLFVCEKGLGLSDNQTKEQYLESEDTHLIFLCEVLNELSEENEQSKMMIATLRNIILENGIDIND